MKVRFKVKLENITYEEVVDIDEEQFKKCEGYSAKQKMNNILSNWVDNQIESEYQIIGDERFNYGGNNMPYLDWETKKTLGWK